jgi:hypothetical protein
LILPDTMTCTFWYHSSMVLTEHMMLDVLDGKRGKGLSVSSIVSVPQKRSSVFVCDEIVSWFSSLVLRQTQCLSTRSLFRAG